MGHEIWGLSFKLFLQETISAEDAVSERVVQNLLGIFTLLVNWSSLCRGTGTNDGKLAQKSCTIL